MNTRILTSILSFIIIFGYSFTGNAGAPLCNAPGECLYTDNTNPGLPPEDILAYEPPEFRTLSVNDDLLNDRQYMRVNGAVNIHNAPDGEVVRVLDEGFNFITVIERHGDWVRVGLDEWIHGAHLEPANHIISRFTGVFWPEVDPDYTVAWMLVNAYPSSEPGGEPRESNGLHYRYTRIMIYDEIEVDGWRWYQIDADKWVHQTNVAKALPLDRPEDVVTDRWIAIDLYEQTMLVYEDERPVFATLISSGRERFPTSEGTFHIYYRSPRHHMTWGTPGDNFYYLQEVPWTMFFDGGNAIHGAYWHDGLGYRRSSGCVNLSITDAHWLYNWVAEEFDTLRSPDVEEGPQVYVYSTGEYR